MDLSDEPTAHRAPSIAPPTDVAIDREAHPEVSKNAENTAKMTEKTAKTPAKTPPTTSVATPTTMTSDKGVTPTTDTYWIALYTRPKSERKAAESLTAQGIETYVPSQWVMRQWSDRRKRVEVVVIPMIIFAKVADRDILTCRKQPLVLRPLATPGSSAPARIPAAQLDRLRFLLKSADTPVDYLAARTYTLGDEVRVIRGNLRGLVGRVSRLPALENTAASSSFSATSAGAPVSSSRVRLVITLDLLGGAAVEIAPSDLEPAT